MNNSALTWTLEGFVDHFEFVHTRMLDHKFVWILGAGASCASGIPLGSELVERWLEELHVRESDGKTPVDQWATAETLGIVNFKFADRASFYPKIYERRFREYPEEGYAYLESLMSGKDPSPGYSVLAAALAAQPPRHNVVITTNFDNLVADSLSIYTDTFPFVCGHESLTAFVRIAMRRPLICKIHRDLLLAPQNDPRSLRRLHDSWGTALRALFQHYTPIFIGYGGNDDTLMDLLESLQLGDIKGQMIWCYWEGGAPSERIVNVVTDHKGVLVPVPDFDLLMVLLGERMKISLLDEEIGNRSHKRTEQYRQRIQRLDTVKHPAVTKALAATFNRSGGWWAWEQKARLEKDRARQEIVYRQALEHCPRSSEIRHVFANFLKGTLPDEAEKLHKSAIDLNPKDARWTCGLGYFTWKTKGDKDGAEKILRSAVELDRKAAASPLGHFLWDARGNLREAEKLFSEAVELNPGDADKLGSMAHFRWVAQRKHESAEELFRSALKLDPTNANIRGNFACFLLGQGRLDESASFVKKAKETNSGKGDQLDAELALYEAVIARARNRDDSAPVARLKQLFQHGFERVGWNFEDVLAFVRAKISGRDHAFFSALAAGILDSKKVPEVDVLNKRRAIADSTQRSRKKKNVPARAASRNHQRPKNNGATRGQRA